MRSRRAGRLLLEFVIELELQQVLDVDLPHVVNDKLVVKKTRVLRPFLLLPFPAGDNDSVLRGFSQIRIRRHFAHTLVENRARWLIAR